MAITITRKGYSTIIVSTSAAGVLTGLVTTGYPKPVGFFVDQTSGTYYILASTTNQ